MAVLQTCCGCFTVESGAALVGIFSFLTSVIAFVGTIPQVQNNVIEGSYTLHRIEMEENSLEKHKEEVVKIICLVATVLTSINMISSLLLLLGIRHRNRFLLLPWIIWTGITIALTQMYMILTTTPLLMGDVLMVFLFLWAELCVVSHYQNLRDGIVETRIGMRSGQSRDLDCDDPPEYQTQHFQRVAVNDQQRSASGASIQLSAPRPARLLCSEDPPPPYPGSPQEELHPPTAETVSFRSPKLSPPPCYDDCLPTTTRQSSEEKEDKV